MIRLYVFDADGTLRSTLVDGQPCPHAPHEQALLPDVATRLRAIPWGSGGPYCAVASNQDHVGYGLLDGHLCREMLRSLITQAVPGVEPLVELCPHRIEEGCACRKPAPGMLLRLLGSTGVKPEEALFVGDAPCDAEAAARAGMRFAWAWDFFGRCA
jgi:D-glycero-D-manno-heptose 1,7-bisphosphate phosphatase